MYYEAVSQLFKIIGLSEVRKKNENTVITPRKQLSAYIKYLYT